MRQAHGNGAMSLDVLFFRRRRSRHPGGEKCNTSPQELSPRRLRSWTKVRGTPARRKWVLLHVQQWQCNCSTKETLGWRVRLGSNFLRGCS